MRSLSGKFAIWLAVIVASCPFVFAAAPAPAPADQPDIVVVGAGMAGLAAALEGARDGARVLVIDMASVFGGHAVMSAADVTIIDTPY